MISHRRRSGWAELTGGIPKVAVRGHEAALLKSIHAPQRLPKAKLKVVGSLLLSERDSLRSPPIAATSPHCPSSACLTAWRRL